ncbi:zinc ribbon domain-containing protein [Heyndrickxia coagulans]|uniref:zinc ribbon domain-containing protein n=1 Tax=Heyndrickxia coagulans TaxID=1398 RepID=UPI001A94E99B|nr:zinc-ribbon domain-containing protein [Heyndrickxia coagulans]
MRYCKQCGHELKPGQTFCTHCGAPVEASKRETAATSGESSQLRKEETGTRSNTGVKLKQLPPYTKWVVLAVVLVLALGFASFKIVQAMNKPSKTAEQFISAIQKNQAEKVASILNNSQNEVKADKNSAQQVIDYYKKNPDMFLSLSKSLRSEASSMEESGTNISKSNDLFSVKKAGKKWLIFDRYGIGAKPLFIKVRSNRSNATVYIDNVKQDKIKKDKTYTYGPYLPAIHKVKATRPSTYTTVSDSDELDPREAENQNLTADLDLEGKMITIYSDYDDAVLYVNDKSTGKKLRDIDTFGPVSTDGSMKLFAKLDTNLGSKKSNTVTIKDDTDEVDFTFPGLSLADDIGDSNNGSGDTDEADIISTIKEHYTDISNGFYDAAYDMFSAERQSKMDFDKWESGVESNVSNDVTVSVDTINGNKATASIYLVSTDEKDGNKTVKHFKGTWNLVKENGEWKLGNSSIKQTN